MHPADILKKIYSRIGKDISQDLTKKEANRVRNAIIGNTYGLTEKLQHGKLNGEGYQMLENTINQSPRTLRVEGLETVNPILPEEGHKFIQGTNFENMETGFGGKIGKYNDISILNPNTVANTGRNIGIISKYDTDLAIGGKNKTLNSVNKKLQNILNSQQWTGTQKLGQNNLRTQLYNALKTDLLEGKQGFGNELGSYSEIVAPIANKDIISRYPVNENTTENELKKILTIPKKARKKYLQNTVAGIVPVLGAGGILGQNNTEEL